MQLIPAVVARIVALDFQCAILEFQDLDLIFETLIFFINLFYFIRTISVARKTRGKNRWRLMLLLEMLDRPI